jgi:hypothetical protein
MLRTLRFCSLLAVLCLLPSTGCSFRNPAFKIGAVVEHRISGRRGQVLNWWCRGEHCEYLIRFPQQTYKIKTTTSGSAVAIPVGEMAVSVGGSESSSEAMTKLFVEEYLYEFELRQVSPPPGSPSSSGPSATQGAEDQPMHKPKPSQSKSSKDDENQGRGSDPIRSDRSENENNSEKARPAQDEPAKIQVTTEPRGARVTVDGKAVGEAPVVIKAKPGKRVIEASLVGYESARHTKVVEPSGEATVQLALEKSYPWNPYKTWGTLSLGASAASLAFGAIAAARAKHFADVDLRGGSVGAREDSKTWAGLMWMGFGLGTALLTTTAVLWALSPGDKAWFEQHAVNVYAIGSDDAAALGLSASW